MPARPQHTIELINPSNNARCVRDLIDIVRAMLPRFVQEDTAPSRKRTTHRRATETESSPVAEAALPQGLIPLATLSPPGLGPRQPHTRTEPAAGPPRIPSVQEANRSTTRWLSASWGYLTTHPDAGHSGLLAPIGFAADGPVQ